jgi:hypothetical protein
MLGPYGGGVEAHGGRMRERVSAEIAALIGGAPFSPEPPRLAARPASESPVNAAEPASAEVAAEGPITIALRSNGVELEYDADLSHYRTLTLGGPASDWLEVLSGVAPFLAGLHAEGRAHGELRVGMLLRGERRIAVIVPPSGVDAAALLGARLRSGAHPTEVAYAAPEVAHGSPATPASDVYALAALAFAAIGRRAPLALVDAPGLLSHLGDDVTGTLLAALDPRPERRPTVTALGRALGDAVLPQRARETNGAVPVAGSSILGAVLTVGAVAVFTGIFGLALTRWEQVGATTQLVSFGSFTLVMLGAGAALVRSGNRRSGVGLCVLAAQLLWADAWLLLAIAGLERSYAAWALAGAAIGVLQCGLAARLGWALMGGFGALAFTVSATTLGLLLPIGKGHGPPAFAAAIALLLFLAELRLSRWRATTVALSVASGFWIAASAVVSLFPLARGELTALFWPYALVLGALGLSTRVQARAGALRLAAMSLLLVAPTAQALLLVDRGYTVHVVALAALAIAVAVAKTGSRGWSLPLSIAAAGWSTASAVVSMTSAELKSWLWVYALVSLVAIAARSVRTEAGLAARTLQFSALGMLVLAPSIQVLVFRDQAAVAGVLALLGVALVAYAARKTGLEAGRERAAIVVGLAAATLGPSVLALLACMNHTATELGERARFAGSARWTYLALCGVVSGMLFALALASRALRREHRRALELAALGAGAGVAFLLSLPVARDDLFYSTMALAFGGAGLTVALLRWRLVLALASAAVMLLVLSVQYFAKLASALHWGLLAVGFGLLVLLAGMLYERRLKQLLPEWNRWD